jgi:putative ABC transport system permease protein
MIETFDSLSNWHTMTPTREAFGDDLISASEPDGTPLDGIARLRWTSSKAREYRGLVNGPELDAVPVIASTSFIEQFGGEDGKILEVAIDGMPLKVSVKDTAALFPTLALDGEAFLITDFDVFHERINVAQVRKDRQPSEFWISTERGSEILNSQDGVLASVTSGDPVVPEVRHTLSSLRTRAGLNITDRTVELSGVAFDPLVSAGWRALLGISFFTVLVVSAVGFLVHARVSFDGRRSELALLRTIGLSMKQLLFLVVLEQMLVIGVAVALGIFMGSRMGTTIMPYLASSGESAFVVPPMAFQIDWTGFGITFGLLGLVFVLVIGLILVSVYRMSIHEVMRIGEG